MREENRDHQGSRAAVPGLGLAEAKALVEGAPKTRQGRPSPRKKPKRSRKKIEAAAALSRSSKLLGRSAPRAFHKVRLLQIAVRKPGGDFAFPGQGTDGTYGSPMCSIPWCISLVSVELQLRLSC